MKNQLKSQNSNSKNSIKVKKKHFSLQIKLEDKIMLPLMKKANITEKNLVISAKNKRNE